MPRNRHFVFRESILRQTRLLNLQTAIAALSALSISVCLLCAGTVGPAKPIGLLAFLVFMLTVAHMRAAIARINQYF